MGFLNKKEFSTRVKSFFIFDKLENCNHEKFFRTKNTFQIRVDDEMNSYEYYLFLQFTSDSTYSPSLFIQVIVLTEFRQSTPNRSRSCTMVNI